MAAKKVVVFTVITGGYDTLIKPYKDPGFRYICFTDNPEIEPNGWEIKLIPESFDSPVRLQRFYKLLPPNFLDCDISVYVDANFHIYRSLRPLVSAYNPGGVLTVKHHARTTIEEEARQIISLGKDSIRNVNRHLQMLKRLNVPNKCGMYESGLMIRDNSDQVRKFNAKWYELLSNGSHRDQLSMGPAAYLTKTKIQTVTRAQIHRYCILKAHKKDGNFLRKSIQYK